MMKHNWWNTTDIIFYDLREQLEWAWRYRDDISWQYRDGLGCTPQLHTQRTESKACDPPPPPTPLDPFLRLPSLPSPCVSLRWSNCLTPFGLLLLLLVFKYFFMFILSMWTYIHTPDIHMNTNMYRLYNGVKNKQFIFYFLARTRKYKQSWQQQEKEKPNQKNQKTKWDKQQAQQHQ